MRSLLLGLAFALMVANAVLPASSANAAVVIEFVPRVASPGDVVEVRSLGQAPPPGGHFDLYLAPSQRVADEVSGQGEPNDARLIAIGRLRSSGSGVARLSFTVPDMAPGTYVVVGFCKRCGSSTFSATGDGLRVEGPAELPNTGLRAGTVIAASGVLLVLGLFALNRAS